MGIVVTGAGEIGVCEMEHPISYIRGQSLRISKPLWTIYFQQKKKSQPAAKCNGEDFLPAVSFAFTLWADTSFFTLFKSPLRQASNNSRPGSFWEGEFCSSNDRRLAAIFETKSQNLSYVTRFSEEGCSTKFSRV